VYRIVRKAFFDSGERKRLYKEARAFLKLRSARKRYVADRRAAPAAPAPPASERETPAETVEV